MRKVIGVVFAVGLLVAGGMATTGTGSAAPQRSADAKLSLVAYSTPRTAYGALIPAFQKTPEGDGVSFTQSYGASGDQARAVKAGLDADIVALSLAPDVDELVQAGLVDAKWKKQAYKGMVTDSVVVFVVRDGNPKHIKSWNDLLRPGVEVITPNPFTSGGARWNVMAAYGAWRKQGKTDKQAQANLLKLWKNVVVQDTSARAALTTFNSGKGDVMLAYENEAITAQQQGEDVDYIVPDQTILIENPIAVTKDAPPSAQAFVDFLLSDEGQKIFAERGYRPVVKGVSAVGDFPNPPSLFTIQKFGGWGVVKDKFFDPNNGLVAKIEQELGVSTDSG
jgi:sulfate transport system substrate-binding protein